MIGPLFEAGFVSGQNAARAEIARLRESHAELLGSLKLARTQVKAIGMPDDENNNAVLEIADRAIANAEKVT